MYIVFIHVWRLGEEEKSLHGGKSVSDPPHYITSLLLAREERYSPFDAPIHTTKGEECRDGCHDLQFHEVTMVDHAVAGEYLCVELV